MAMRVAAARVEVNVRFWSWLCENAPTRERGCRVAARAGYASDSLSVLRIIFHNLDIIDHVRLICINARLPDRRF
jgi:hypothetical protein